MALGDRPDYEVLRQFGDARQTLNALSSTLGWNHVGGDGRTSAHNPRLLATQQLLYPSSLFRIGKLRGPKLRDQKTYVIRNYAIRKPKRSRLVQSRSRLVRSESGALHSTLHLGILHEDFPDVSGAGILGHDHGYAGVDADDVSVIPAFHWVECIHEAVAAHSILIAVPDGAHDAHCFLRQEGERSSSRSRTDGAVDWTRSWRATPDHVTFFGIGSGDAPEIGTVVRKTMAQFYAEPPMHFSSRN